MGPIRVLENYTDYDGLPNDGTASTGIVFAVSPVGRMRVALFVWIAAWLGRKWLLSIGTVVTATAPPLPVFIGGRFEEIRPREKRGSEAAVETDPGLHPSDLIRLRRS